MKSIGIILCLIVVAIRSEVPDTNACRICLKQVLEEEKGECDATSVPDKVTQPPCPDHGLPPTCFKGNVTFTSLNKGYGSITHTITSCCTNLPSGFNGFPTRAKMVEDHAFGYRVFKEANCEGSWDIKEDFMNYDQPYSVQKTSHKSIQSFQGLVDLPD